MQSWLLALLAIGIQALSIREERLAELIHWLRKEGAFVERSVRPECEDEHCGLIVTQAIEEGKTVIELPLTSGLPMHVSDAYATLANVECLEVLSDEYLMAAMLSAEINSIDSRWRPYLLSLPEKVDLPRNWPDTHLPWPTSLAHLARDQRREDDRALAIVQQCMGHEASNNFKHAITLLASRIHTIWVWKEKAWSSFKVLLPVVDLLNWSSEPNLNCSSSRSNRFACIATRSITPSQVLTAEYGRKGSDAAQFFFLDYGFLPETASCSTHINATISETRIQQSLNQATRPLAQLLLRHELDCLQRQRHDSAMSHAQEKDL